MNMLSPDSRCYSFDARGNGYGRGEGVGMLVLKRLGRALQDGDTIRAVLRSTASNQNGYTPGITQPSTRAQQALIDDCYARAGLDKARTVYVEAHGTGTPVGDPIEAEALGASFKASRRPGERLYVYVHQHCLPRLADIKILVVRLKPILATWRAQVVLLE